VFLQRNAGGDLAKLMMVLVASLAWAVDSARAKGTAPALEQPCPGLTLSDGQIRLMEDSLSRAPPETTEATLAEMHVRTCERHLWLAFTAEPAKPLLTGWQKGVYNWAITRGRCGIGEVLLRRAFRASYPEMRTPLRDDGRRNLWMYLFAATHFTELPLCALDKEFDALRTAHERAGARFEPYRGIWSKPPEGLHALLQNQLFTVMALYQSVLARSNDPTLALFLLRLSLDGDVLRYSRLYEFRVATLLSRQGVDDPAIAVILARPPPERVEHWLFMMDDFPVGSLPSYERP